jgi:hypothetical protein
MVQMRKQRNCDAYRDKERQRLRDARARNTTDETKRKNAERMKLARLKKRDAKAGTKDGYNFEYEKDRQNDRLNIGENPKYGFESTLSTMAGSNQTVLLDTDDIDNHSV